MKKLVATILTAILIMVYLTGCSFEEDNSRYDGISKTDNINIEFWTDKETGVQYIVYDRVGGYAGMGGITPRLNSDGSVYIEN